MNRCEQVQNELKAYLDHRLPFLTRLSVKRHLQSCPACRGELSAMEKISNDLRADAPKPLGTALRARILQAASAPAPTSDMNGGPAPSKWRRKPLIIWGATAAALTSWFLFYPFLNRAITLTSRAGEQVAPASTERRAFTKAASGAPGAMVQDPTVALSAPVGAAPPSPPSDVTVTRQMSNMRQLGQAKSMYTQSYDEEFADGHATLAMKAAAPRESMMKMMRMARHGVQSGKISDDGGRQADRSTRSDAEPERQVHREAQITLKVDNVETGSEAIEGIVKNAGGYTADSRVDTGADDDRTAFLTLKVPVAQFQTTLNQIARQGEVHSKQVNGEDLTEQIQAQQRTEEKLKRSIRDSQERLQQKLSRSKREEEQDTLHDLRDTLNQNQGQLKHLHNASALATLSVELHEKSHQAPAKPKASGFVQEMNDTLHDAFQSMVQAAHLPILTFIWILAYSPLWLLLILGYRWAVRR